MYILFIQDKIKTDIKKKNIQQHIARSTHSVTKRLQWQNPFEWWVKKIYKSNYLFSHSIIIKTKIPGNMAGKLVIIS
jgi:hypothetical protein